jgi:hypothetical protein
LAIDEQSYGPEHGHLNLRVELGNYLGILRAEKLDQAQIDEKIA